MSHNLRIFQKLNELVDESVLFNQLIPLSSKNTHHLINVLRLSVGDNLILVDEDQKIEYEAKIEKIDKEAFVSIISRRGVLEKNYPVKTLLFALCKGDKNELVCEKCTELGVKHFIFWQAHNSIVRLKNQEEIEKKEKKLSNVATSAAKQSGKNFIASVEVVLSLEDAINTAGKYFAKEDNLLCASLEDDSMMIASMPMKSKFSHLVIGPEGDFSHTEKFLLGDSGFVSVSLGEDVLRSETAAIAGVAMIHALSQISID